MERPLTSLMTTLFRYVLMLTCVYSVESNGRCSIFFVVQASFNEDLNQEMANLDSLMKDLNALKQNGLESC